MKKRIHDISLPVSESLAVWPGDPPIRITQSSHLDRGDKATVSQLSLGAHSGTHVDAPAHFIPGGAGVDTLDLGILTGPALVVDAGNADALRPDVIESLSIPPGTERLLFRTRNSGYWEREGGVFHRDFAAITEEGARLLVSLGVRLVGVDYLSVAPFGAGAPTHREFLRAGVILVEGLNLSGIAAGPYHFICLPIRIPGVDGAPARAILIEDRDIE